MTKRRFLGIGSVAVLLVAVLIFPCLSSCSSKTAPDGLVRNLTWALGAAHPVASDFAGENGDGYEYSFVKEPNLRLGENQVSLRVRHSNGKTWKLNATVTLVEDLEPPKATGIHNLEAGRNTPISLFWDGIQITDNCDCPVIKQVDTSRIDYSELGVYEIIYTVTDQAGNKSEYTAFVEVVDRVITSEMLNEKIDVYIREMALQDLPVLEQCRRIYTFVNQDETIHYGGESNDPARISWVREAYLALETGKGDCYTYFALSKAFFVRLGIPYLDVQRLPGLTEDTHYWLMVNIGTEDAPRWYHFDATRLRERIYSGGILTDSQIRYYSENIRINFYYYDSSKYPATDTVEVSDWLSK